MPQRLGNTILKSNFGDTQFSSLFYTANHRIPATRFKTEHYQMYPPSKADLRQMFEGTPLEKDFAAGANVLSKGINFFKKSLFEHALVLAERKVDPNKPIYRPRVSRPSHSSEAKYDYTDPNIESTLFQTYRNNKSKELEAAFSMRISATRISNLKEQIIREFDQVELVGKSENQDFITLGDLIRRGVVHRNSPESNDIVTVVPDGLQIVREKSTGIQFYRLTVAVKSTTKYGNHDYETTLFLPSSIGLTKMSTLYHTLFTTTTHQSGFFVPTKKIISLKAPADISLSKALSDSPFNVRNLSIRVPVKENPNHPNPEFFIELPSGEIQKIDMRVIEIGNAEYYTNHYLPEVTTANLKNTSKEPGLDVNRPHTSTALEVEVFKKQSLNHHAFWDSQKDVLSKWGYHSPKDIEYIPFIAVDRMDAMPDIKASTTPNFELVVLKTQNGDQLYYRSSIGSMNTGGQLKPFSKVKAPFAELVLVSLESQPTVMKILSDDSGMVIPQFLGSSGLSSSKKSFNWDAVDNAFSISKQMRDNRDFDFVRLYSDVLIPLQTEAGKLDRHSNQRIVLDSWLADLQTSKGISPDAARRLIADAKDSLNSVNTQLEFRETLKKDYQDWLGTVNQRLNENTNTSQRELRALKEKLEFDIEVSEALSTNLELLKNQLNQVIFTLSSY